MVQSYSSYTALDGAVIQSLESANIQASIDMCATWSSSYCAVASFWSEGYCTLYSEHLVVD